MQTPAEFAALGRIRANRRHHPDKPELVEQDRQFLADMRAQRKRAAQDARAQTYLRQLIDTWPTLSEEKRAQISALLAP